MGHHLHLFAGHPEVLRRYTEIVPQSRMFRLSAGADLVVLPIDEDLLDALHKHHGTGEWHEILRLTSTDLAFAAQTSRRGSLAYLETDYSGGAGKQAAVLWSGGALALRPLTMTSEQARGRPAATWPVNAVLQLLGVTATAHYDAFDAFGLGRYRSIGDIFQKAFPAQNAQ